MGLGLPAGDGRHGGGAEAEEGFLPLPVCVRPPNVDKSITLWSYWAGGHTQVRRLNPGFATQRYPQPTFLYDPNAPPENTKVLPDRYKALPCDPKPPPPSPPPEPEKTKPKKEVPQQEGSGGSGSSGHGEHDKKGEKKEHAESPRPAPPEAPPRAAEEEARHPRLPDHGVTTDWPKSVLPTKEALLPTKRRDDRCAWTLPWPGQKPIDRAQVCPGNGEGNGDGTKAGVKKTWAEKAAESLAYMAGGLNLQFDEDLKRPDGKQYGVMGGRNPDGPNNPFMQAVASGVMIAAAVLSPKAEKFFKRLTGGKAAPLLMKEMEEVGRGMADELATKLGPQHGGGNRSPQIPRGRAAAEEGDRTVRGDEAVHRKAQRGLAGAPHPRKRAGKSDIEAQEHGQAAVRYPYRSGT